jgi:hypothetical protein
METFKCRETFKCHVCRVEKIVQTDGGTGYASRRDHKICYECCGRIDARRMERGLPVLLYYDGKVVSNWPGTLKVTPYYTKIGRHNVAGKRTDVWFRFKAGTFHGTRYGDMSQVLRHVKAIKV